MFKSIYDFTKVFSFLFLLTGLFFILKEAYITAFIMMSTFFIVRLADTDYAFDMFKFKNHSGFVVTLTFVFMAINGILLVHEMRYSPYFHQYSSNEKESYIKYEDSLFTAIKPCLDYHNYMINALNNNIEIQEEYEEQSNKACSNTISHIESVEIPYNLNGVIRKMSEEMKADFRGIALSLSRFHYFSKNDSYLINKIKQSNAKIIEDILKIRKLMRIESELKEDRRNFLLL